MHSMNLNDMFTISATVYEMLAIFVGLTPFLLDIFILTQGVMISVKKEQTFFDTKQHMLPNVDFVKDY